MWGVKVFSLVLNTPYTVQSGGNTKHLFKYALQLQIYVLVLLFYIISDEDVQR